MFKVVSDLESEHETYAGVNDAYNIWCRNPFKVNCAGKRGDHTCTASLDWSKNCILHYVIDDSMMHLHLDIDWNQCNGLDRSRMQLFVVIYHQSINNEINAKLFSNWICHTTDRVWDHLFHSTIIGTYEWCFHYNIIRTYLSNYI